MPVVNPYAKKKASAPVVVNKPLVKEHVAAPTLTAKEQVKTTAPIIIQPLKTTAPAIMQPLKTTAPAIMQRPMPPIRPVVTPVSHKTPGKKTSFKTQLKQQIQDLKRKKKLEAERKLMEARLKERQVERQRQEVEHERLRQEYQKKKDKESKQKDEERRVQEEKRQIRVEEEKLRAQKVADERLANERVCQENQRQQEMEYQQRLVAYQQRQMLQYGYVPNSMLPHTPLMSHMQPATPVSYFYHPPQMSPIMHAAPAMTSDVPAMMSDVPPAQVSNFLSTPLIATPPYVLSTPHASLPQQPPLFHNPMTPYAAAPLHMTPSSAALINRWTAPPTRPPPPPQPPKILSNNPLESPSPFQDFEILHHTLVIVKEAQGGSFGVSVQVKTQSVLTHPDVWEALMRPPKKGTASPVLGVEGTQQAGPLLAPTSPLVSVVNVAEKEIIVPTLETLSGVISQPAESSGTSFTPIEKSTGATEAGDKDETMKDEAMKEGTTKDETMKDETMKDEKTPSPTPETSTESPIDVIKHESVNTKTDTVLINNSSPVVAPVTSLNTQPVEPVCTDITIKPESLDSILARKKRRKRAFFHVMCVTDASKQNSKNPETDLEKKLRPGDVILEINGMKTCGLPFFTACQLFASCKAPERSHTEVDSDLENNPLLQCCLLVARRKPKPPTTKAPTLKTSSPEPPPATPLAVNTKINIVVAGEFNRDEMMGLAAGVSEAFVHSGRLLGYEASIELMHQCIMSSSSLVARDQSSIQKKLSHLQGSLDTGASVAATTHWKQSWDLQHSDIKIPEALKLDFITLAQLSDVRALPRPLRGCRCGGSDHDYVNSPKCILYHGLRKLSGKTTAELSPTKKVTLETSMRDLSAMEIAFKDRIVKMKEEQVNDAIEAKFVDEMEKVQVRKQQRAIFAPNFTTMVLCAIAAIGHNFDDSLDPFPEEDVVEEIVAEPVDEDEEQDDDDLPLFSLGKRPAIDAAGSPTKKAKIGSENVSLGFHPAFLAQVLIYIGRTWGHVYRESTHSDFTWRWEVHHGQTSEAPLKREKSKNPRTPGSPTLAHVEFAVGESMMERFKATPFANAKLFVDDEVSKMKAKQWAEDMLHLAYLVSPKRTGLLDELKALEQVSIFRKSKHGAAVLTKDWFTRVDPLILEDMDTRWSFETDPDNKYLIHSKVKRDLANYWIRVDGAWALNEDLSELVFLDHEWDEWRRSLEDENEKQADKEDGIGKFGI